jgi:hypothetical protein
MSLRLFCIGSLGLAVAAIAPAAETAAGGPLRPVSECLDPDRARSWHLIDSDEILVDAGRRRFHLQLSFACPELGYNHTVGFRSGNGVGRICGHQRDVIVTMAPGRRNSRCGIADVTPLDRKQYEAYLDDTPKGVVETREPTE